MSGPSAEGGDTPPGRGPGDPIDLPPPRRRRVVQSGATHLIIGFGDLEVDDPAPRREESPR